MDDFSKKNRSPTTNCFNNRIVAKRNIFDLDDQQGLLLTFTAGAFLLHNL